MPICIRGRGIARKDYPQVIRKAIGAGANVDQIRTVVFTIELEARELGSQDSRARDVCGESGLPQVSIDQKRRVKLKSRAMKAIPVWSKATTQ